jgi:hypothetical protein
MKADVINGGNGSINFGYADGFSAAEKFFGLTFAGKFGLSRKFCEGHGLPLD